jgi:hypothetical protein
VEHHTPRTFPLRTLLDEPFHEVTSPHCHVHDGQEQRVVLGSSVDRSGEQFFGGKVRSVLRIMDEAKVKFSPIFLQAGSRQGPQNPLLWRWCSQWITPRTRWITAWNVVKEHDALRWMSRLMLVLAKISVTNGLMQIYFHAS